MNSVNFEQYIGAKSYILLSDFLFDSKFIVANFSKYHTGKSNVLLAFSNIIHHKQQKLLAAKKQVTFPSKIIKLPCL